VTYELRAGSIVQLRTYQEFEDTDETFQTIDEALAIIAELDDQSGYSLIDLEQPVGSTFSVLLDSRASQWERHADI
jgi:hypothetical protein